MSPDCSAFDSLPEALVTLEHIHCVHTDAEISAYHGTLGAESDIYVVSGSARKRVTEFIDSLMETMRQEHRTAAEATGKDVAELDRLFNLKPSRKGSASGTAHKSRSTTQKKPANS